MLGRHLPCRGMLFITKLDGGREENPRGQDRITSISTSKRTTDGNKCRRSFSPKCLMLFYDCYEKSSLSLSFSLRLSLVFSPSQTTDPFGYFRWGNADCSLLISLSLSSSSSSPQQRARAREREKDRFTIGNERKRGKRKNIIVTANPIISLMYVCVD